MLIKSRYGVIKSVDDTCKLGRYCVAIWLGDVAEGLLPRRPNEQRDKQLNSGGLKCQTSEVWK